MLSRLIDTRIDSGALLRSQIILDHRRDHRQSPSLSHLAAASKSVSDTASTDGEQVMALVSTHATRPSCTIEVSTVMLLTSDVLLLSRSGRWKQYGHSVHHGA